MRLRLGLIGFDAPCPAPASVAKTTRPASCQPLVLEREREFVLLLVLDVLPLSVHTVPWFPTERPPPATRAGKQPWAGPRPRGHPVPRVHPGVLSACVGCAPRRACERRAAAAGLAGAWPRQFAWMTHSVVVISRVVRLTPEPGHDAGGAWATTLLREAPHMGEHELLLDPAIRNWVLIPIVIIMFLMGLLRNNVTKMLRKDTPPKREQIKINNQLMRCRRLRANGHFLPPNAFYARKGFFCDKEKGVLMVKQVPSPLLRLLLRPTTSSAAAASSSATTTTPAAASRAVALHRRPRPSCPQPPDEHSSPHAWRPATLRACAPLRAPAPSPYAAVARPHPHPHAPRAPSPGGPRPYGHDERPLRHDEHDAGQLRDDGAPDGHDGYAMITLSLILTLTLTLTLTLALIPQMVMMGTLVRVRLRLRLRLRLRVRVRVTDPSPSAWPSPSPWPSP